MAFTGQTCRICNATGKHTNFVCREMMFGTREEFSYFKCSLCGCLQITDFPLDMARFYPDNYYSLSIDHPIPKGYGVLTPLIHWRIEETIFGKQRYLDQLIRRFITLPDEVNEYGPMLKNCGINNFDWRIVDVGCGARPFRLAAMQQLGFRNVLGIDPFIASDTKFANISVLKKTIDDLEGVFDLIMFHHSFEHIANQVATLRKASALLTKKGICLIRIPLVDSELWDRYGTDWIELDAPRHFYLHSHDSIKRLAHAAGLTLKNVVFDSGEWEFIGSEQYRQNIPMRDPRSWFVDKKKSIFTNDDVLAFKKETDRINSIGRGGRAAFYFGKD